VTTHWDKPSHFIGSESCHFGLTDVVNGYVISSVGDYRPALFGIAVRERIGYNRYYETMVFRDSGKRCAEDGCACGRPLIDDYSELGFDGYMTEAQARDGHAAMLAKYAAMVPS
jgi:hypothetical protein